MRNYVRYIPEIAAIFYVLNIYNLSSLITVPNYVIIENVILIWCVLHVDI